MTNKLIVIFSLFTLFSCTTPTKTEIGSVEEIASASGNEENLLTDSLINNLEEEDSDCVFNNDIKGHTLEAIAQKPELKNFSWDEKNKQAIILLDNKDTLTVSIGGCTHYNFMANYITYDSVAVKNYTYWFDKVKWMVKTVFKEEDYTTFAEAIDNKKLTLDGGDEVSSAHFSFPETTIFINEVNTGIYIEKEGNRKSVSIGWYLN